MKEANYKLQTCAHVSREFPTIIIAPNSQMRKWRLRWTEPRFKSRDVWLQKSKLTSCDCWDWLASASSPGLQAAQAIGSGSGTSPLPWGLQTGPSGQLGLADPPALAWRGPSRVFPAAAVSHPRFRIQEVSLLCPSRLACPKCVLPALSS